MTMKLCPCRFIIGAILLVGKFLFHYTSAIEIDKKTVNTLLSVVEMVNLHVL